MSPVSLPPRTTKKIAAASAATAAAIGALYANHRYGFTHDITTLLKGRAARKRFEERLKVLDGDYSLYHMVEVADQNAEALWFEGRRWTFAEVLIEANKLATVLLQDGVLNGDRVAIMASNSPEMVFAIVAVTKLGAIPAMINAALRKQTLVHCLRIASPKTILCTPDLASALAEVGPELPTPTPGIISLSLLSFPPLQLSLEECVAAGIRQLRYEDIASISFQAESMARPKRALKDTGVLIYTSGTSGKPKAVACKNFLLAIVSTIVDGDARNIDRYFPLRTFSCLPLFHGTCFFSGLCYSIGTSSTFCLARKFSASRFSKQLTECGATRTLYVGELCRFLLPVPESPYDKAHKCIVATGNGLPGDVWLKFKHRFNIQEIREVYRSTEGIAKFDNFTNTDAGAGMVGYAGPIRMWAETETYLVKYNPLTEMPYRDPQTGFCITVKKGEPGEAIGRVTTFDSYNDYLNDPAANEAKLIHDVFEKGDVFQRTGDLLVRDSNGWVKFHDRCGDTFRWRGENVSAGEVREHISKLPNVEDASVYGIKLQAYDGQAGAAAITLKDPSPEAEKILADQLYKGLRSSGLTTYQLPRLVRFSHTIEQTATFKQQKTAMKERPWDPEASDQRDSVYYLHDKAYRKLDPLGWIEIQAGRAKL